MSPPSGDPFDAIMDLERHEGYPRNPFINAGARLEPQRHGSQPQRDPE